MKKLLTSFALGAALLCGTQANADHDDFGYGGRQGYSHQGQKENADEVVTKLFASLAIGGMSGVAFMELFKLSASIGILAPLVLIPVAFFTLRSAREDTIKEFLGPKYVGASTIAALLAALIDFNLSKNGGSGT